MNLNMKSTHFQNSNDFDVHTCTKMNNLIQHAYNNSKFYKFKYNKLFFGCPFVKSKEDFLSIPLIDGKLIEGKKSSSFIALPKKEICYTFFSSGTNGNPKTFFYNYSDWNEIVKYRALCYEFVGITSEDIVQIMVPYGIWSVGQSAQDAFKKLKTTVIPTGCWKNAIFENFEIMKKLKTTVLMTTPSIALIIGQELIENNIDISENYIEKIITTGENVSKQLRSKIEEMWGAKLISMFASSEAVLGIECSIHDGFHVLNNNIIIEIIDECGDPVKEGEIGELVITPLNKKMMPLIRYKMGDMVQLVNNCECGCSYPKFRFICRKNNNFVLSTGVSISEYQVQKSLNSLSFEIYRYQVILKDDLSGKETVSIYIETHVNSMNIYEEALQALSSLSMDFFDSVSEGWVGIELNFLKIGTLSCANNTSKQMKKFIDLRKYPK